MKKLFITFAALAALVLIFALARGDIWPEKVVGTDSTHSGEDGGNASARVTAVNVATSEQSDLSGLEQEAPLPRVATELAPPNAWPARLRELEFSARSDANAFADLTSFRTACQYWRQSQQSQDEIAQARREEWAVLEVVCSGAAIARFDEALASASRDAAMQDVMLQPWHHSAGTAEEFAARDSRLEDQMQRAASAAAAFSAAIVYFDYERFSQWAGPLRPWHLHDDRSYRFSRIGLDVAWMYACRLGLDCGPYSGTTLLECWETPGCVPGGAARQVVQMRRSPLELRLVDSMVDRLLAERAGARR